MKNAQDALNPPVLLAIAYAPPAMRARFAWLLMLDQRLSNVLNRSTEPMIAQLRLSWWRDALSAAPEKRPKGEPLLAELAALEADTTLAATGIKLVDAFEILAAAPKAADAENAQAQRISAICGAYAVWVGGGDQHRAQADAIARWWHRPDTPMPKPIPRILRPLSIVALAAHLDSRAGAASPMRLNWHALTGR